jgi:Holliday junction DNA helicase RuvA
MIEYISGILLKKESNYIIIDVNGMGYKISISLNTYDALPVINKKVSIDTFFHVTENNQSLFGFLDSLEKELFGMLISVSGIGPKTAIGLLSAVKPNDFKQRLIAGEVKMLTSLPGIGPKTAKRIIIELKDKFIRSDVNDLPLEDDEVYNSDAYYALLNLGFRSNNIKKVIDKVISNDSKISTENLIKESLKKIR